jgi:uncharacterized protein YcbK (DUF882 family)
MYMNLLDFPPSGKSRRDFLKTAGAIATFLASPAALAKSRKLTGSRTISLHNLHTEEKIKVDYWVDGRYEPEALAEIDLVLRDHRANEICSMDPKLIDIIHSIQQRTLGNTDKPVEVISAYRSPTTNNNMRRYKRGVAKNSFHMLGQAVDVRVPGFSHHDVYRAAVDLEEGGIGYYGRAGFVHLDTGKFRTWGSRKRA